jgi:hypothetical protein
MANIQISTHPLTWTQTTPSEHAARRKIHRWKHMPNYDLLENWRAASKVIDALLIVAKISIFESVVMVVLA